LLARPGGGALAVVAHVDRAWSFSFQAAEHATPNLVVFKEAIGDIFRGVPLGHVMTYFNDKYAELASDLSLLMDNAAKIPGFEADTYEVVTLWTAHNDARSYIIIGDPAVTLPIAAVGKPALERPVTDIITVEQSESPEEKGEVTGSGDKEMNNQDRMREGVHDYQMPTVSDSSLRLKKEDPELYAIWRDQIKDGYEQNSIMFTKVLNAFMQPYHETVRMYQLLFAVGISLFVVAVVLSVWSKDPLFGLVFGGMGVGTFLAFFVSKPLRALEENIEFITWLGIIYNNYWTRLTNIMNEETVLEDIRAAGKDASDELERLIVKHAEIRGKRPVTPKSDVAEGEEE